MILPPQGSSRGSGQSALSKIERSLMRAGYEVISSGLTGRIVQDAAGNRVESGSQLSDLERALVLARNSNANALLQVDVLGWFKTLRVFAFTTRGDYEELDALPVSRQYSIVRVHDSSLRIEARLISVEDGKVLVSFDISQSTFSVAPVELKISKAAIDQDLVVDNESLRERVTKTVLNSLLGHLGQRTLPEAGGTGLTTRSTNYSK